MKKISIVPIMTPIVLIAVLIAIWCEYGFAIAAIVVSLVALMASIIMDATFEIVTEIRKVNK